MELSLMCRLVEVRPEQNTKTMNPILAIDPGTKCGYALIAPNGSILSGVWDLSTRRFEGGGMRFVRLKSFLNTVLQSGPISAVCFEEVHRHLGTDAAHCYGGIVAGITEWAETNNIPYTGIPVQTIKKRATGKGNANKEAMLQAAKRQWPDHQCADDNEADARWLAVVAKETYFSPQTQAASAF